MPRRSRAEIAQFPGKAIVSGSAEHRDARAQGGEVGGYGAGGSGSDLGGDDADARDTGFARGVGELRVVAAPAVEADIAYDEDAQLGEFVEEIHGSTSARHSAGTVARCSPQK